jgi:protein gp37
VGQSDFCDFLAQRRGSPRLLEGTFWTMTKHNTAIEWTHIPGYKGETWNPIVGCSIASPGCKNCYAMRQAARIVRMSKGQGRTSHYEGTFEIVKDKPVWTGKVVRASEKTLTLPLRWKKRRAIFVNSMGDLFHEDVPDEWIDRVFAVMALAPQHIFIVLTKRAERMREYLSSGAYPARVGRKAAALTDRSASVWDKVEGRALNNLPNVWLGVSVEDQKRADERIPHLLETPAAERFISAEPLLGEIDLGDISLECRGHKNCFTNALPEDDVVNHYKLDWVIAGGESGPGARPMHPDWVRDLRDQCEAADTPFFFKQWGEWAPAIVDTCDEAGYVFRPADDHPGMPEQFKARVWNGENWCSPYDMDIEPEYTTGVIRVGKAHAGCLLDGVEHSEFPKCVEVENA